jgi:hypothetical protein
MKFEARAAMWLKGLAVFASIGRNFPPTRARSARLIARSWIPTGHFLGHGERTLAFILTSDTINFGSRWFPELKKRPGKSGSVTLASWLCDAFAAGQDFSASKLVDISARDCARIFDQDLRVPAIAELMQKFADALNELGHLVIERFHGNYAGLAESAGQSAESLVAVLRTMPFFEDVESWRGRRVPFYKRAQLTVAKLALAFDHSGWGKFRDLDQLTIFADTLVPHVLRVDGVLLLNLYRYSCSP